MGFWVGSQKPPIFSQTVLTIFHNPTGYGATSPWGLMTFPGTLHLFHHPDRKNHSSQISSQWQHLKDWCWKCLEGTGLSESQSFGSTTPLLKHSLPPRVSGLVHRTLLLCALPLQCFISSLMHMYLSAFIWEQNVLYKCGEIVRFLFLKYLQ